MFEFFHFEVDLRLSQRVRVWVVMNDGSEQDDAEDGPLQQRDLILLGQRLWNTVKNRNNY